MESWKHGFFDTIFMHWNESMLSGKKQKFTEKTFGKVFEEFRPQPLDNIFI